MATAQVIGQARDTDCSVCHDHFKDPKILPCGHVVCRPCLVSWIQAQPLAGCPLCRCAVLETEGQPGSLEEEVEALPTDLALAELVEARALLDKDHTCCVCDDVVATAICLHCGDTLCATCTKVHGKLSVSKHHKVEDLSSVTPELLIANRPTKCSSHPDLTKTLFCPTHGMSVCFQCVATVEHRSCPKLRGLEEKTEEARVMLSKMAASLTASESDLEEAIQRLDHHILVTEETVQAAITQIQKTCDRLESGLKSCRGRIRDLAHDAASVIQNRARAAIKILHGRKSQVTLHTAVVQRAEGSLASVTVSDMHSLMQTRVQKLDCSIILPASAEVCSTMKFVIDEQAVTQMEQALADLGRVHLVPADHLAVFPQSQTGKYIFHGNHGANIVLSNSNRTAKLTVDEREEFHGHGIVLSRDPITADVIYEVCLDMLKKGGGLSVGVLTDRPYYVAATEFARLLLTATSVSSNGVNLIGTDKRVDHPICSVMKELQQGDCIGVSLDTSHRLHLYRNGEDQGVWATGVTGPCYALVEMRGKGQRQVTALPLTTIIR